MRIAFAIFVTVGALTATSVGQVVQLYGPNELSTGRITISFDGYPHYAVANTLYQSVGVLISRDDGGAVPILDAVRYGYQVPSGSNILFSGFHPEVGPTQGFTTHLTIGSLEPLTEIGAFFGNDNYLPEFAFERLSIFGATNEFLGSIDVAVNNNGHIDQFIGLRSSVPFYSARFENYDILNNVSEGYGVAIDDLTFTIVTPPPKLRVERLATGQVRLSWSAAASSFTVQTITNIAATNWQDVLTSPVITGSENVVTNAPGVSPIFFRLRK